MDLFSDNLSPLRIPYTEFERPTKAFSTKTASKTGWIQVFVFDVQCLSCRIHETCQCWKGDICNSSDVSSFISKKRAHVVSQRRLHTLVHRTCCNAANPFPKTILDPGFTPFSHCLLVKKFEALRPPQTYGVQKNPGFHKWSMQLQLPQAQQHGSAL